MSSHLLSYLHPFEYIFFDVYSYEFEKKHVQLHAIRYVYEVYLFFYRLLRSITHSVLHAHTFKCMKDIQNKLTIAHMFSFK